MSNNNLYRTPQNKVIAGVFGGISEKYDINANLLRIAFVFLTVLPMLTLPMAVILYGAMWMLLPVKPYHFDGHRSVKYDNF